MAFCYVWCLLIFLQYLSSLGQRGSCTSPVRISTAVKKYDVCSSRGNIPAKQNGIKTQIRQSIVHTINLLMDQEGVPPPPCNGAGWIRVAFLNMTEPSEVCPSNLSLHTSPVRGCGQRGLSDSVCDSVVFPVGGLSYSSVCGRLLAYQKGLPEAFVGSLNRYASIESLYVDGASLTHGPAGSRQHIWTFAAALEQGPGYLARFSCPCINTQYDWPYQLPAFIGNNYFCDTGNHGPGWDTTTYYTDDPLWDGEGCGPFNTCCQFNSPPWFQTTLPQTTSDDIELRLCLDYHRHDEDIIIFLLDIYVK